MLTNTPLEVCDVAFKLIEEKRTFGNMRQSVALPAFELEWLAKDAEHLNKLNSRAMELGYEDAESALNALRDYEK